jgi:hypothetical protein
MNTADKIVFEKMEKILADPSYDMGTKLLASAYISIAIKQDKAEQNQL